MRAVLVRFRERTFWVCFPIHLKRHPAYKTQWNFPLAIRINIILQVSCEWCSRFGLLSNSWSKLLNPYSSSIGDPWIGRWYITITSMNIAGLIIHVNLEIYQWKSIMVVKCFIFFRPFEKIWSWFWFVAFILSPCVAMNEQKCLTSMRFKDCKL